MQTHPRNLEAAAQTAAIWSHRPDPAPAAVVGVFSGTADHRSRGVIAAPRLIDSVQLSRRKQSRALGSPTVTSCRPDSAAAAPASYHLMCAFR